MFAAVAHATGNQAQSIDAAHEEEMKQGTGSESEANQGKGQGWVGIDWNRMRRDAQDRARQFREQVDRMRQQAQNVIQRTQNAHQV